MDIVDKIKKLITEKFNEVNTFNLGKITAIDNSKLQYNVKLKHKIEDKEIELFNVPLAPFQFGAGMILISLDIGDIVGIIFSKHELKQQLKNKDITNVNEVLKFDINNAMIISGAFTDVDEIPDEFGNEIMLLKHKSGSFIKFDSDGNLIINDLTQGDIFYVNASGHIVKLAAGTDGWFLKTQGAGANPLWASVNGGGGDMSKSTYDTDDDGVVDNSEKLEGSTKVQVQDHTPKAHTLASHSSKAHNELTGIGSSDHHTLYSHPSARQCNTGDWAWGSITGKPSNYPTNIANISDIPGTIASILNDHNKAAHDALNIDADQVDACHAGVATGNVFKIPAGIAQGDIFYVNGSGNVVRLAAGTNGHFLKTQGAAANPIWAAGAGGVDTWLELTDTPGAFDNGKLVKSDVAALSFGMLESDIFKKDGSVAMTGDLDLGANGIIGGAPIVYADVDTSFAEMRGGHAAADPNIMFFGKNYSSLPGDIYCYVPNAAKTTPTECWHIDGVTNAPYLSIKHGIKTDVIAEKTAATGVTVDSCLIKDGVAVPASHGADKHTNITREIFLSVGRCYTTTTHGKNGYFAIIQLPDGATSYAYFSQTMPADFVELTDIKVVLITPNATGTTAVFHAITEGGSDGQTISTHTVNCGNVSVVLDENDKIQKETIKGAGDFSVYNKNDMIGIRISRFGSDGNDNYEDIVYLVGIIIEYTADQ